MDNYKTEIKKSTLLKLYNQGWALVPPNSMKPFYKSRTFWLNILATVAGLATMLEVHVAAGGVITTLSLFNLLLRFLTTEGIKIR